MGPKKTLPGKVKVKKAAKAKKNELKGKENGLQKRKIVVRILRRKWIGTWWRNF